MIPESLAAAGSEVEMVGRMVRYLSHPYNIKRGKL